eukprot:16326793-Heterocapsa_arctica.AAC.1
MGKWTSMLPGPKGGEMWRPPPSTASSTSTEGITRIDFMICNQLQAGPHRSGACRPPPCGG